VFCSLSAVTLLAVCGTVRAQLTPAEALESIEVHKGFTVEFAALEPNVVDPIALCFDENGRMYVCEMRGFQLGPGGKGAKDLGRIRLLDDRDGDGRFETAVVFADKLTYPTTVMPYAGGILVGAAPDIIFFKDTDGDDRADVREVLYTGFGTGNHEQLLNTLQFHFDNWIYACAGGNGGDIRSTRRPDDPPVSMRSRSFRMRPFTGPFEATSGGGQYGLSSDDWGRFFVCTNANHIIQRVLPDHYLRRNPFLPVSSVVTHISDHDPAAKITRISPMERWRVIRTKQRAADPAYRKRLPPTELVPGGYITAACSVQVYRGGLFGPDFVNNTFVCDASNNLVHRTRLVDNGVTYIATRTNAIDEPEFFASRDNWCRPCFLTYGPDGAIYICDMQRQIIETPASIPESIQQEIDMEAGNDMGRIYRIVPKEFQRPAKPNLGAASIEQLVAQLENPNAWYRHTAQRLLFERQDRAAVKPLLRLAAGSKTPQGRLHALWMLDGLNALPEALIIQAMEHAEAGLRQNAVRLAEKRLCGSASQQLVDAVLARADDDHARVRFQLAFTLGELRDPRAVDALAAIAAHDAETHWVRTAVLSSSASIGPALLQRVLRNDRPFRAGASSGKSSFLRELTGVIGAQQQPDAVSAIVRQVAVTSSSADTWWRAACLRGLGEGLRRGNQRTIKLPKAQSALIALLQSPTAALRDPAQQVARTIQLESTDALRKAVQAALTVATTDDLPIPRRAAAVGFLGFGTFDVVGKTLATMLNAQQPKEIQTAGIAALGTLHGDAAAQLLVDNWRNFTPDIRSKAVDALFADRSRLSLLLTGIEEEKIQPWSIDPQRRDLLLKHADAKIKRRASAVFTNTGDADRRKVFDRLKPLLELTGDPTRGFEVYKLRCSDCHQLTGVGQVVGPDLKGVKDRPAEQLLRDMIIPSLNLTPGYDPYVVRTTQGDYYTGILASETTTSVTLKRAKGEQDTILRRNIEDMYLSNVSIMPAELEKDLSDQQIADLIAFLKNQK
jgi:putative membrane-bound dehydrogenase-like protein